MEIKSFIESVLVQIVEGAKSANESVKESGAKISSKDVRPLREGTTYNSSNNTLVNLIEFDIAVTVSDKDKGNGGAGIKIAGFSLGGGLETEKNNQTVSRIKFSIPLTFPH